MLFGFYLYALVGILLLSAYSKLLGARLRRMISEPQFYLITSNPTVYYVVLAIFFSLAVLMWPIFAFNRVMGFINGKDKLFDEK